MSLSDYKDSLTLVAKGDSPSFEALIMAALRKGSRGHGEIRVAFPAIYAEFHYRYWCSGGIMPGEPGYVRELDDNLPVTS